jgi:hypothetical protein
VAVEDILVNKENQSVIDSLKKVQKEDVDTFLKKRARIVLEKITSGTKSLSFKIDKQSVKQSHVKADIQDIVILQNDGIKKLRFNKKKKLYDLEIESSLINPLFISRVDDKYFVSTINSIFRLNNELHIESDLKIGEIIAFAGFKHGLLVSSNKSIFAFDKNLELLGKTWIGKNPHDIVTYNNIAYLLDNVMKPLFIIKLDIEKMKVIQKKEIIGINSHLVAQSLDLPNSEWLVFQIQLSMSENDVQLFSFDSENIRFKKSFYLSKHNFFKDSRTEDMVQCVSAYPDPWGVITNEGKYFLVKFNTNLNKIDLDNITDLQVDFQKGPKNYYFLYNEDRFKTSKMEKIGNYLYIMLKNHFLVLDVSESRPKVIVKQSFDNNLNDFCFSN